MRVNGDNFNVPGLERVRVDAGPHQVSERDGIADFHSELVRGLTRDNATGLIDGQLALDGGRAPSLALEVDQLEHEVLPLAVGAYATAQHELRFGDPQRAAVHDARDLRRGDRIEGVEFHLSRSGRLRRAPRRPARL